MESEALEICISDAGICRSVCISLFTSAENELPNVAAKYLWGDFLLFSKGIVALFSNRMYGKALF